MFKISNTAPSVIKISPDLKFWQVSRGKNPNTAKYLTIQNIFGLLLGVKFAHCLITNLTYHVKLAKFARNVFGQEPERLKTEK